MCLHGLHNSGLTHFFLDQKLSFTIETAMVQSEPVLIDKTTGEVRDILQKVLTFNIALFVFAKTVWSFCLFFPCEIEYYLVIYGKPLVCSLWRWIEIITSEALIPMNQLGPKRRLFGEKIYRSCVGGEKRMNKRCNYFTIEILSRPEF